MRATFTYLIGPHKGKRADFNAGRISVGRAANNILCLGEAERRVSAHHAEVTRRGDQFVLRDLGSTNGTSINGRRVMVSELAHDDLVEFGAGGPLLRFEIDPENDRDTSQDQVETISASLRSHEGDLSAGSDSVKTAAGILKSNRALIGALVAAMVLGGVGGIVASSRLRASDPETMSFTEVAELNSPAVVFIRAEFELVDSSGKVTTTEARTGSGFIVSESGLIVTNRHLVRDWDYNAPPPGTTGRITRIEAILPHRKIDDALPAEVYKLGPDSTVDVAILKISFPSLSVVRGMEPSIADSNQGDEVVVIGYPLGLDLMEWTHDTTVDPSISTGIVSRVGHDFIQLSLRAYHGNSGGPVLNRRGNVIGILTANIGSAQDIALCTPISSALALVRNVGEQASLPASLCKPAYSLSRTKASTQGCLRTHD